MWRNVFGHAIYQGIAIFMVIFAGQHIGLSEPFEIACNKYDDNEICLVYNPFYARKFYVIQNDVEYWETRRVPNADWKEGDPEDEKERELDEGDFDQDQLVKY